jgi:hypothetical protein
MDIKIQMSNQLKCHRLASKKKTISFILNGKLNNNDCLH